MNSSLQVFNPRIAYVTEYSVPAEDTLSDDGTFALYPPAAPVVLIALIGRLDFVPSVGATGHRLLRRLDSTLYTEIAALSNPATAFFSDADIVVGGLYRVLAFNTIGDSLPSNTITVDPDSVPAPVALDPTDVGPEVFTLNWAAATAATSYAFDLAFDSGFSHMVPDYSNRAVGEVTSFVMPSGQQPFTNYYYRVRGVNYLGASANSNTITFRTPPPTPP